MKKDLKSFSKAGDKLVGGLISATLVVLLADRALERTGYKSIFAADHEYLNGALDFAVDVLKNPTTSAVMGPVVIGLIGVTIAKHVYSAIRNSQDMHRSDTHIKILTVESTISPMLKSSGLDISNDIGKASYKDFKALNIELAEVEAQLIAKGIDQPERFGLILGNLKNRNQGPISILDAAKGMLEGMKDIALNGAPAGTMNEVFKQIKNDLPVARKPVDDTPSLS
jgi:hypothetical protein